MDLSADEFFFRLEPAIENLRQQRETMRSENFDVYSNLKRSYERLAGMPILVSAQISKISSTLQDIQGQSRTPKRDTPPAQKLIEPKRPVARYRRTDLEDEADQEKSAATASANNSRARVKELEAKTEDLKNRVFGKVGTERNRADMNSKIRLAKTADPKSHPTPEKSRLVKEALQSDAKNRRAPPKTKAAANQSSGSKLSETQGQDLLGQIAEAAQELDDLMRISNSGLDQVDVEGSTELPPANQPPGLAECGSARSDILESEQSGDDDFLNWKLSAVDFESPAKLQSILGQEQQENSSLEETESFLDENQQHRCYPGQWTDGQFPANHRLPHPEAKFQFRANWNNTPVDPRIQALRAQANSSPSVEFSVPVTQFLYVPSISTNEFPSIQASFGDMEYAKPQASNSMQRVANASGFDKRLEVTCIVLLKEWAYIAQQRKIVRNGVLDEQWIEHQRPSLRFNLVIGFARKLDKMFKIWVVSTAWMTSCKNIYRICAKQTLSEFFWTWKCAMLQRIASENVCDEIRRAKVVGRAVYDAHIAVKDNSKLTERDMRGYTNLLRRAIAVRAWLQVPVLKGENDTATIPRAFYGWKDVLRDNKLIQLHLRVEQIESLLAQEPLLTRSHETSTRGEITGSSKFDRACLENLSREMLLSLGREEDDELQERMVMLLQIVAEVNQNNDDIKE